MSIQPNATVLFFDTDGAGFDPTNDTADFILRRIFVDTGFTQTITGQSLIMQDFDPFIQMNSNSDVTITNDIAFLDNSGAFFGLTVQGASGNVILPGVLSSLNPDTTNSNVGRLQVINGVTATLSGANTHFGRTDVGALSTLIAANDFALGAATGTTIVSNGATLSLTGNIDLQEDAITLNGVGVGGNGALRNLSGNNTVLGTITLGSATRIQSDADLLTLSGGISGTQNLTFGGAGDIFVDSAIATGAGSVTIDGGTTTFSGANTYSGGTTITAGALQLGDGGTSGSIVGDVLNNGALTFNRSDTMTFSGLISGTGAVNQDGAGATILTGANTYSGGSFLNDGILSVSADNNLGDATGALTFDGGALQNTAAFTSARDVTLNAGGGAFETQANLTLSGDIGGAGALTKTGSETLTLTGANTYGGGTTISAGTLQLGDGGASGSVTGDVLNNGALAFNRSDDVTFAGLISGSGAVNQVGAGATILTANNTYTGPTTISGGALQLGDGGTSGAIVGDILNNSVLAFNRSDTFETPGVISGSGAVEQNGVGATVLTGDNTYTGGTTIAAGALQLGDGGATGSIVGDVSNSGTLAFNRSDAMSFNGVISGAGAIRQIGPGLTNLTGDSSGFAGSTSVEAGALAVNGALCGEVNVLSGGRLQGAGVVCDANNFAGGTVAPGNSIGILTVNGDYIGDGGTLEIEAVLGDDSSQTDLLVVTGATSGTSNVQVINLGGAGAQTVEGIKIIDIGGASDGVFTLLGDFVFEGEQAVIAGAYAYTLQKNGVSTPDDGDWYLRSALTEEEPSPDPDPDPEPPVDPAPPLYQPGAPLYEAYPQTLLALNELPTLRQRAGARQWKNGVWGRAEGALHRARPKTSTSGADYDIDLARLEAGVDIALREGDGGVLIGGLVANYAQSFADISSVFGVGDIDTEGYGVGATLTWQGDQGFYADLQGRANWYNSDIESDTLGWTLDNGGSGQTTSLEFGRRAEIGRGVTVIPQMQHVYSRIDFDAFADPANAVVSRERAESFEGRYGIALDYSSTGESASGKARSLHAYAIANLYYEFLDGPRVGVSGTQFASEDEPLRGGLGLGGDYNWNDGRFMLYGEASADATLNGFGDSYRLTGRIGLRMML